MPLIFIILSLLLGLLFCLVPLLTTLTIRVFYKKCTVIEQCTCILLGFSFPSNTETKAEVSHVLWLGGENCGRERKAGERV